MVLTTPKPLPCESESTGWTALCCCSPPKTNMEPTQKSTKKLIPSNQLLDLFELFGHWTCFRRRSGLEKVPTSFALGSESLDVICVNRFPIRATGVLFRFSRLPPNLVIWLTPSSCRGQIDNHFRTSNHQVEGS